jgi:hypothetical protein
MAFVPVCFPAESAEKSDHCEWENFESLFHPDAYVYTTWTGRTAIADFIKASKAGMDNGAFIMHRIHGTSVELQGNRAVAKMKATITQRFNLDQCLVDAEADCRFCMFFEKRGDKWGAAFVRHWYEKDKLIPVDPRRVPRLDDLKLETYPNGYRYLAYCQEATMGVKVKMDMPGHRNEGDSVTGKEHDKLYFQMKQWLDGEAVDI